MTSLLVLVLDWLSASVVLFWFGGDEGFLFFEDVILFMFDWIKNEGNWFLFLRLRFFFYFSFCRLCFHNRLNNRLNNWFLFLLDWFFKNLWFLDLLFILSYLLLNMNLFRNNFFSLFRFWDFLDWFLFLFNDLLWFLFSFNLDFSPWLFFLWFFSLRFFFLLLNLFRLFKNNLLNRYFFLLIFNSWLFLLYLFLTWFNLHSFLFLLLFNIRHILRYHRCITNLRNIDDWIINLLIIMLDQSSLLLSLRLLQLLYWELHIFCLISTISLQVMLLE